MCRRNLVFAAALIGFGAGMLLSLVFESGLIRFILAAAGIAGGFFLLKCRC